MCNLFRADRTNRQQINLNFARAIFHLIANIFCAKRKYIMNFNVNVRRLFLAQILNSI